MAPNGGYVQVAAEEVFGRTSNVRIARAVVNIDEKATGKLLHKRGRQGYPQAEGGIRQEEERAEVGSRSQGRQRGLPEIMNQRLAGQVKNMANKWWTGTTWEGQLDQTKHDMEFLAFSRCEETRKTLERWISKWRINSREKRNRQAGVRGNATRDSILR